MSIRKDFTYRSRDGIHRINAHLWLPVGDVRGVVQISHGMCEYILRYREFAEYLTNRGFAVCGNDHLGHGGSVFSDDELGYFAREDGWRKAVDDLHSLTRIVKKKLPGVSYFLLGHSMGSFMARAYCIKYGYELSGAVFCGTGGEMKGISGLIAVVKGIERLRGERHRSRTVNLLAFGTYVSRIENCRTTYDWLSRDDSVVDKFIADSKCRFTFTLNGFENLMRSLRYVNRREWFEAFDKELPVLLMAGDSDPVGNYGEGVEQVYRRMILAGCGVKLKLYNGARHELLNEINCSEVYGDVLKFFEECISG